MPQNNSANNKRIAKNTLVLYVRMLFLMVINLYTSRIILQALGIEDFGLYSVVGGFVGLFAILTQSLSSAASRFLNYEMGIGNKERLKKVFSTTCIIHFILAMIIVLLAEIVGVWFINNKMVMSPDRISAVNWIFQFSVLSFCVNLITVPHNAAIIAHEKMSAFAYISIFEGIGMLLICYLVMITPLDKLAFYGFLMFVIRFVSRFLYYLYCRYHFWECNFHWIYEKDLLCSIFSFASWNMIGSSSAVLRNQGGNVLINLFGGPVVNAARGISNQVLQAVNGFVENYFTALRPQITKAYARGDITYMMTLIFQGSRIAFYMLLIICLPIMVNTNFILHLWLKTVPDHSVAFVRLTLIFTMIESFSIPLITAKLATGKIRNYQLVVGGLQMMNIPVSFFILKMGGVPETILYVAIFISVCCLGARLYMLKTDIKLNVWSFVMRVMLNALIVSLMASTIPSFMVLWMDTSLASFVIVSVVCMLTSILSVLYIGCKKNERQFVFSKLSQLKRKIL